MTAAPACELLPWDTAFFGVRIGRVQPERLTPEAVAAAGVWAAANEVNCLYALVDAEHTPTLRALDAERFTLVDVRLTLDRDVPRGVPAAPASVRLATPEDVPTLQELARVSHRNTRFYEDGRFDRRRCDELYATWIGKAATEHDAIVLVPDRGGRPSGYLSVHQVSGPAARIGLIAVSPDLQGQGMGEALMEAGLAEISSRGAARVTVVTQGRNARAVRFYEKCGFRARACQFWYHRWFA